VVKRRLVVNTIGEKAGCRAEPTFLVGLSELTGRRGAFRYIEAFVRFCHDVIDHCFDVVLTLGFRDDEKIGKSSE
jgi:hypothetical protein